VVRVSYDLTSSLSQSTCRFSNSNFQSHAKSQGNDRSQTRNLGKSRRLTEAGCTTTQAMAITGHKSLHGPPRLPFGNSRDGPGTKISKLSDEFAILQKSTVKSLGDRSTASLEDLDDDGEQHDEGGDEDLRLHHGAPPTRSSHGAQQAGARHALAAVPHGKGAKCARYNFVGLNIGAVMAIWRGGRRARRHATGTSCLILQYNYQLKVARVFAV
jgi:hypothetical protein